MELLNDILSDRFINASQVAAMMQPDKTPRIAANTVRKRTVNNQGHSPKEIENIRPHLALLKHKIEIFLEKSRQKP